MNHTHHYFIDVEALGPPGVGGIFALGLVEFELDGTILQQQHWNIRPDHTGPGLAPVEAHGDTLAWLSVQSAAVRAQLRDAPCAFSVVWQELRKLIALEPMHPRSMLWADDWADFAWLDIAARRGPLESIRMLGTCADSTAIVEIARRLYPRAPFPAFDGERHVAVDDARHGARELCRALDVIGLDVASRRAVARVSS